MLFETLYYIHSNQTNVSCKESLTNKRTGRWTDTNNGPADVQMNGQTEGSRTDQQVAENGGFINIVPDTLLDRWMHGLARTEIDGRTDVRVWTHGYGRTGTDIQVRTHGYGGTG